MLAKMGTLKKGGSQGPILQFSTRSLYQLAQQAGQGQLRTSQAWGHMAVPFLMLVPETKRAQEPIERSGGQDAATGSPDPAAQPFRADMERSRGFQFPREWNTYVDQNTIASGKATDTSRTRRCICGRDFPAPDAFECIERLFSQGRRLLSGLSLTNPAPFGFALIPM
jgi:hypothetical protein